jgi:hypothetical protein
MIPMAARSAAGRIIMLEQHSPPLIPPPGPVRVELARTVREASRLRALLRLSVKSEQDQQYIKSLRQALQAVGPEVAR